VAAGADRCYVPCMADAGGGVGDVSGAKPPLVLVDVTAVSRPEDAFRCEALRAQMTGRLCAQRHLAKRHINGKIRNQPEYPSCAACPLGAGVVERLGGLSKLPARPPPRPILQKPKGPEPRVRLPVLPPDESTRPAGAPEATKAARAPAKTRRRAPAGPSVEAAAEEAIVETTAPVAPSEEGPAMSDGEAVAVKKGRMSAEKAEALRGRIAEVRAADPSADIAALAKSVRAAYVGAGDHPPTLSTVRSYLVRTAAGAESAARTRPAKAAKAEGASSRRPAKAPPSQSTELARVREPRLPSASASWAGSMQLAKTQNNIEQMIEPFPEGDRRLILANLIVKFGVGFGG
jgi:hypothetical protein